MFLAGITGATARVTGHERRSGDWTSAPQNGQYCMEGFGQSTDSSGSGVTYQGNVGNPWGSNIIEVDAGSANQYKNVFQLTSQEQVAVVFWNKIGPDGKMDGWFGHSALNLNLSPGQPKYVALMDDSQGGFAAGKGSVPTNDMGEYASTWGEFSTPSKSGWAAFDVSAIIAQNSGMPVMGMQICQATGDTCSSITQGASVVKNAYTAAKAAAKGIGGNLPGNGPVRLAVTIGYNG